MALSWLDLGETAPEMEVEAEDAIVVASEVESSGHRQRRLRKLTTKARQNDENPTSSDTVRLSPWKRPTSTSQITTISGMNLLSFVGYLTPDDVGRLVLNSMLY